MISKDIPLKKLYQYYVSYTKSLTNYIVMDQDTFYENIIKDKIVLVENHIDGFICAVVKDDICFITLCYGDDDTKMRLLKALEEELDDAVKEIKIHFFNPVKIPFEVQKGKYHTGIQGVEYPSSYYDLLKSLGFVDNSLQHTFLCDLSKHDYTYQKHLDEHVFIGFYDETIHTGLDTFCEEINNEHFKNVIESNKEYPLLIVACHNKVVGFAGPLSVDESKRGVFGGIQILSGYQGKKFGSMLFHQLCFYLKEMGATYMTLFTGDNNKAKYIYMKNGFHIVESFMTVKKDRT